MRPHVRCADLALFSSSLICGVKVATQKRSSLSRHTRLEDCAHGIVGYTLVQRHLDFSILRQIRYRCQSGLAIPHLDSGNASLQGTVSYECHFVLLTTKNKFCLNPSVYQAILGEPHQLDRIGAKLSAGEVAHANESITQC